jgi:hypothetical protein
MKILLLGLNFAPELTGIGKYTDMAGAGLGWGCCAKTTLPCQNFRNLACG